MGFAEKKLELLKIVVDADEETTGKLIEFANQLKSHEGEFSTEEITAFQEKREEYLRKPDAASPWEESMERIRKQIKK